MDQMKVHWSTEKDIIKKIQTIKSQVEALKIEEANAQREGNLEKAAEIRYGKLVALNKELEEDQKRLEEVEEQSDAQGRSGCGRCSRGCLQLDGHSTGAHDGKRCAETDSYGRASQETRDRSG